MLMTHSPLNQEIEFLISFIDGAKSGEEKYLNVLRPLFEEAKSLVTGKIDPYQLSNNSVTLKLLLQRQASSWLLKTDFNNVSVADFEELEILLNENNLSIA